MFVSTEAVFLTGISQNSNVNLKKIYRTVYKTDSKIQKSAFGIS